MPPISAKSRPVDWVCVADIATDVVVSTTIVESGMVETCLEAPFVVVAVLLVDVVEPGLEAPFVVLGDVSRV